MLGADSVRNWGVLEGLVALLILGVVRLLSDWSMANVGGGHDDKDRRVSMKACLLKKVYENLTDWRSKRLGRKLWQYVIESVWACGAGVLAARLLP